jgi:hypothetical protein
MTNLTNVKFATKNSHVQATWLDIKEHIPERSPMSVMFAKIDFQTMLTCQCNEYTLGTNLMNVIFAN